MMTINFEIGVPGVPWSQLCWHYGELFPVMPTWVDHVKQIYIDGNEKDFLEALDIQGDYHARVVYLEGADAQRAVRILRLHFPWVEPKKP